VSKHRGILDMDRRDSFEGRREEGFSLEGRREEGFYLEGRRKEG
jgi:hypothetical protein